VDSQAVDSALNFIKARMRLAPHYTPSSTLKRGAGGVAGDVDDHGGESADAVFDDQREWSSPLRHQ
jgi:hypothetical protein